MKKIYLLALLSALGVFSYEAFTFSTGPLPSKTGAPGEVTCASCHSTGAGLNQGPENLQISVAGNPTSYVPGQTYTVTVSFTPDARFIHGFQIVALNAANQNAGTWVLTDLTNTQPKSGNVSGGLRRYVEHTLAGTGLISWSMNWIAPAASAGIVTFYAAGNAANGDGDNTGDNIYTESKSLTNATQATITASVNNTVFCAGSNMPVNFTATGNFNTGNFFTAQLSNSSGSFANPVAIGTMAGTGSGTIQAVAPASAVGSGYRVRVVASVPATTGTENGSNLTINQVPVASVTSNGPVSAGGTLQLSTPTVSGATYTWTGPGGFTSNLQNPAIANATTGASGGYCVTVTKNGCSSVPACINVIVNAPGSVSVSVSQNGCLLSQTLTATASGTSSTPTPTGYCASNSSGTQNFNSEEIGVRSFSFAGINKFTPFAATYSDFTASVAPAQVVPGNTYLLTLESPPLVQIPFTNSEVTYSVYIDYNFDGDFADTGENVTNGMIMREHTGPGIYSITSDFPKNVTIPAGALTGTTRLRIVAVDSQLIGVNPPCGTNLAGETEDYLITIGSPVTFSWSPAIGLDTTAGPVVHATVSAPTVYTVTATFTGGVTAQSTVTVNPLATISGLTNSYCSQTAQVTLSGTPAGGTFSGPGVSGNTFDPSVAGPGSHTVTYTVTANGCTYTPTLSTNVLASPVADAGPDQNNICDSTTTLSAAVPATGNGQWTILSGSGGNFSSPASAASSFSGVTGQSYILLWTVSSTSCGAVSDTVQVTFQAVPITPVITALGTDSLAASTIGSSYVWKHNGNVIPVTTQYIEPQQSGSYTVTVTGANGCISAESTPFVFTGLGLSSINSDKEVQLFPNPSQGLFTLQLLNFNRAESITVYNASGQEMELLPVSVDNKQMAINLGHLPKGMYWLRITMNGGFVTRPLRLE